MNYQRTERLISGATKIIVLPKELDTLPITVQVIPDSGATATIQVSCDTVQVLESDTSQSSWSDVDPASVTASTIISISTPISGIKITSASGATKVNLRSYRQFNRL